MMEDIQTKVESVRCKVRDDMICMQAHERWEYLGLLSGLVQDAKKQELDGPDDLGNATEITDVILQLHGPYFDESDRCMLFPNKNELQTAFNEYSERNASQGKVEVGFVLIEKNFTEMQDIDSANYLKDTDECFFSVGSVEQAVFVIGLKSGIHISITKDGRSVSCYVQFVSPYLDMPTRAMYRQIGLCALALKGVDTQLKKLGALPDDNGVPMLPDSFVQDDEFDFYIDSALSKRAVIGRRAVGLLSHGSVAELTKYLCTMVKVDRRKLIEKLHPLAAKRLELLLELGRINQTTFPFAFRRGFNETDEKSKGEHGNRAVAHVHNDQSIQI